MRMPRGRGQLSATSNFHVRNRVVKSVKEKVVKAAENSITIFIADNKDSQEINNLKHDGGELKFGAIDKGLDGFGKGVFFSPAKKFENGRINDQSVSKVDVQTFVDRVYKFSETNKDDDWVDAISDNFITAWEMLDIVEKYDSSRDDSEKEELYKELNEKYNNLEEGQKWIFDYVFACNHILKDDPGIGKDKRGASFVTHEPGWDTLKALGFGILGDSHRFEFAGQKIEKQASEVYVAFSLLSEGFRRLRKMDLEEKDKKVLARIMINDCMQRTKEIVQSKRYLDKTWQSDVITLAKNSLAAAQKVFYAWAKIDKFDSDKVLWNDEEADKIGNPMRAGKKVIDMTNGVWNAVDTYLMSGGAAADVTKLVGQGIIDSLMINIHDILRKYPEEYRLPKERGAQPDKDKITKDEMKVYKDRTRRAAAASLSYKGFAAILGQSIKLYQMYKAPKTKDDRIKILEKAKEDAKKIFSGDELKVNVKTEIVKSILNDIKLESLRYFENCTEKNFKQRIVEFTDGLNKLKGDSRTPQGKLKNEIIDKLQERMLDIEDKINELQEKDKDGLNNFVNHITMFLTGVSVWVNNEKNYYANLTAAGSFARGIVSSELNKLVTENPILDKINESDFYINEVSRDVNGISRKDFDKILKKNTSNEKLLKFYGMKQFNDDKDIQFKDKTGGNKVRSIDLVPDDEGNLINDIFFGEKNPIIKRYIRTRLREAFYRYENKLLESKEPKLLEDDVSSNSFLAGIKDNDELYAKIYYLGLNGENYIDREVKQKVKAAINLEIKKIAGQFFKEGTLPEVANIKASDALYEYIADSASKIKNYEQRNAEALERLKKNPRFKEDDINRQKELFHNGRIQRLFHEDSRTFNAQKKIDIIKNIDKTIKDRNVSERKASQIWEKKLAPFLRALAMIGLAVGICLVIAGLVVGNLLLGICGAIIGGLALAKIVTSAISASQKTYYGPANVQKRNIEKEINKKRHDQTMEAVNKIKEIQQKVNEENGEKDKNNKNNNDMLLMNNNNRNNLPPIRKKSNNESGKKGSGINERSSGDNKVGGEQRYYSKSYIPVSNEDKEENERGLKLKEEREKVKSGVMEDKKDNENKNNNKLSIAEIKKEININDNNIINTNDNNIIININPNPNPNVRKDNKNRIGLEEIDIDNISFDNEINTKSNQNNDKNTDNNINIAVKKSEIGEKETRYFRKVGFI